MLMRDLAQAPWFKNEINEQAIDHGVGLLFVRV